MSQNFWSLTLSNLFLTHLNTVKLWAKVSTWRVSQQSFMVALQTRQISYQSSSHFCLLLFKQSQGEKRSSGQAALQISVKAWGRRAQTSLKPLTTLCSSSSPNDMQKRADFPLPGDLLQSLFWCWEKRIHCQMPVNVLCSFREFVCMLPAHVRVHTIVHVCRGRGRRSDVSLHSSPSMALR